jgi:carboxyl-terminal processing protease
MLLTLVLASAVLQGVQSDSSLLATRTVEAIDGNYLYAERAPWRRLRGSLRVDTNVTVSSLDRQLEALHDGDLRIITPLQMRTMQAETMGKERGIGLVDFAVEEDPQTGKPRIVTPLLDSPAFKAGLRPNDVILAIDGRATQGLIHEDVMAMLRGDSGTLRLTILREQRRISMNIPMEAWDEQAVVIRDLAVRGQQIGYVGVRLFTPDSGDRVRKAVESLAAHGVPKCVIDLRNNPGGYLDAMTIAGSAFTDQVLGWKVRRDGTREPIHAPAKPFQSLQLVVLVNGGTASAAEVLATGLRDTAGARLLGAKTHGRGQIQTYVPLKESGGIIIPTANAESPHGMRFNNGSGISPDVFVSSSGDTTSVDAALERAMQLLAHS